MMNGRHSCGGTNGIGIMGIRKMTDGIGSCGGLSRWQKAIFHVTLANILHNLSDFLNDKAFRKSAINLLVRIDDPRTDEILQALVNNKDSDVRSWGKYGLQERKSIAEQKNLTEYPSCDYSRLINHSLNMEKIL
ncbi:MAG: HEAT repeat domain-containing protein [Chloroflexi bacterium]|nr:HEAT repeat domain-containing protein [Chloroflexota bacterium]